MYIEGIRHDVSIYKFKDHQAKIPINRHLRLLVGLLNRFIYIDFDKLFKGEGF